MPGAGKVIGSFCAISGVLVMSLPIPIITANFAKFYRKEQNRERAVQRKAMLAQVNIAPSWWVLRTWLGEAGGSLVHICQANLSFITILLCLILAQLVIRHSSLNISLLVQHKIEEERDRMRDLQERDMMKDISQEKNDLKKESENKTDSGYNNSSFTSDNYCYETSL